MKSFKVEKHIQGRPEMFGLPYQLAWTWIGGSILMVMVSVILSSVVAYFTSALLSGGFYMFLHFIDSTNVMDKINSFFTPYPKQIQNNKIKVEDEGTQ